MRLHPRTLPVQRAGNEIRGELLNLQLKHDLTDVEMLQILAESAQSLLKGMLRVERHPDDPDCGGDEASDDDDTDTTDQQED